MHAASSDKGLRSYYEADATVLHVSVMMQARLIDTESYTLRVLGGISGTARPARLPTLTTQLSGTWLSGKKHACLTDTHLPARLVSFWNPHRRTVICNEAGCHSCGRLSKQGRLEGLVIGP